MPEPLISSESPHAAAPASMPPRPVAPSGAVAGVVDRLRDLRHDPRLAVVLLVVAAVGAGVFWFRSGVAAPERAAAAGRSDAATASPPPVNARRSSSLAVSTTTVAGGTVVVDVAGAVAKPGVVTVAAGTRVIDAISAAGGAQRNADLDRLNLAAKVTDGERIAVPVKGQPPPALDPTSGGNGDGTSSAPSASNPLNLNAASAAELEALPGIGPTLAAAIVQEREQLGGFKAVDDLKRVRGIGDARFAQLQPLVTV